LIRKQTLPFPDGTLSQGDRQHVTWNYSGILAIELILYIVIHGTPSLAPWIVQAQAAALASWIAVTTADIEDLTP
jgi:hypothetical protein